MDFGKDYKFYDPNYAEHPNHNHIICNDCEKIVSSRATRSEAGGGDHAAAGVFDQDAAAADHGELRGAEEARACKKKAGC